MNRVGPWLFAACAAFGPAAMAQEIGEPAAPVTYEADFFQPFTPRTALDMVRRAPGFVLEEGEDRRGFAGAQSNVLIDGEPPAAKQAIESVLARIPASDVVRIEVMHGAGPGGAQGVRINIVRDVSGAEGVWEASAVRAEDGEVSPGGEAAWSGGEGALRYGVSLAYASEHAPFRGARADYEASGALDETRRERIPTDEREARLGAEAEFPWLGGAAALTLQISRATAKERERAEVFDAAMAPDGTIRNASDETEDSAEFGASWRSRAGAWRTSVGAVLMRRRFAGEERAEDFDSAGGFEEGEYQTQRLDTGETILRAGAERDVAQDWRLAFGAEGAFNTLEQRLTLTEDAGAGPTPITLPSANVLVEEARAEAHVLLAGALAPHWRLEASLAGEVSRLTQGGDAAQDTDLAYWKPSLQLTRAIGAQNQIRLRLFRDVGQLDFEDFVSARDVSSSLNNAGNSNLRPETSWRLELAGDWRFAREGAFNLTLYRWAVSQALDFIPVGPPGNQLDAVGNIGDASVNGARVALTLPLPGRVELRLDGFIQRSQAHDPLTGARRSLSEFDESALTLGLRQDLSGFAWGADYEMEREAASYRLDRIEQERDPEDLTLWIETSVAGVKLRAWGANLLNNPETRTRRLFDPDRLGSADGSDARTRRAGPVFGVALSGSF